MHINYIIYDIYIDIYIYIYRERERVSYDMQSYDTSNHMISYERI